MLLPCLLEWLPFLLGGFLMEPFLLEGFPLGLSFPAIGFPPLVRLYILAFQGLSIYETFSDTHYPLIFFSIPLLSRVVAALFPL